MLKYKFIGKKADLNLSIITLLKKHIKNLKFKIIFSLSILLAFRGIIYTIAQAEDKIKEFGNVIIVGWDGAQREHLMELLSSGQLPNLRKLISEGSMVFTEVTTATAHTKPGWAEILTGYSAEKLGILDNRNYRPIPKGYTIFERLERFFGFHNIITIFIGGKINNIGDRGPHEICVNCIARDPVTRHKTFWWDKQSITTYQTTDRRPPVWTSREGEPYFESRKSIDFYLTALGPAENVAKQVLSTLERYHNKLFFAFFHFEEPDEQGHLYGENSQEYSEAIKTVDYWLGEIVKKLKALGIYEKTSIYVISDHGMNEGGFEHNNALGTFLATNNKTKLKDGDRKDITSTILEEYGIDLKSISPSLDGKSLFCK